MKKKKILSFVHQKKRGIDQPISGIDIDRLRSAQKLMNKLASQTPPLSHEQIHDLISSNRPTQSQLHRQADSYLLIFSLSLLTLAAIILWHTAPAGLTPFNVTLLILTTADGWVAIRAVRSLWLMWLTYRLRHRPYRMLRYADRLDRLSHRRRWWLQFALANRYDSNYEEEKRQLGSFPLRLPYFAITTILVLLIVGVFTWFTTNNHYFDSNPLVASSHTEPYSENLKPNIPSRETAIDSSSILSTTEFPLLKSHSSPPNKTQTLAPSVGRMSASVAPSQLTKLDDQATSTHDYQIESAFCADINQLIEQAEIYVICNNDSCSAERYCKLIHKALSNS